MLLTNAPSLIMLVIGLGVLTLTALLPPELAAFQGDEVGFRYDPDQANALLQDYMAEAGIESAEDIVIELWYNRGNEEIIQAVAVQWSGNLGIRVNQINMEWPVYLSTSHLTGCL